MKLETERRLRALDADKVSGPASSTDNAAVRFDSTTGKLVQNSAFLIDDTGHVTSFGGQIKFPATQNPSSDANTLDDYEEGTWTPGVAFGGGTTGITYSQQVASYTKIGDRAFINARVVMTSKGTSTGTVAITGLPFTAANVTNQLGAINFTGNNYSAASNTLNSTYSPNSTTIAPNNFAAGASVAMNDTYFTDSTTVVLGGNYPTA